ncbi:unnamed protein product [Euphydryas editha]|uniref:Uncharacterized protein n=1 Tax=Euphydryas editha TaxID=104508 RepID=A0AAU9V4E8_EUPED|nr:unnamed protein product [Euphydryas editha]
MPYVDPVVYPPLLQTSLSIPMYYLVLPLEGGPAGAMAGSATRRCGGRWPTAAYLCLHECLLSGDSAQILRPLLPLHFALRQCIVRSALQDL